MRKVVSQPSESLFANREKTHRLMKEAVLAALCDHKQADNPIAVWEDGKVKIIQPEDIVLPEEARGTM